eukprot:Opistho-1_new@39951
MNLQVFQKKKLTPKPLKSLRKTFVSYYWLRHLVRKKVLAIDPGYRTGCKTVVLDAQGNLLHDTVIYPFDKSIEAQNTVLTIAEKYQIDAIAVGNGTAGRETEDFVKKLAFKKIPQIFVVSEQGASIYSASPIAREEFPDKDVTAHVLCVD